MRLTKKDKKVQSAMWISTQISNTKRVHRTTAQGQNQFPAKLCTVVAVSATKARLPDRDNTAYLHHKEKFAQGAYIYNICSLSQKNKNEKQFEK